MADFLIKAAIITFGFVPLGVAVVVFMLAVMWFQVQEDGQR